jgi:hypothetical protein
MMKRWSSLVFGFASLLILVPSLHSQAVYTADSRTRIQAGIGVLALNPDYTDAKVVGLSAWGDYDFSRYVGAEISAHFENIITSTDIAEDSYMIGPRFTYRRRRMTVYAKAMVGRGTITNQLYNLSSSYNLYAFGGGLEYKLGRRWNVRVLDFEQEEWINFQPHTLGPTAVTIGLSYIIH